MSGLSPHGGRHVPPEEGPAPRADRAGAAGTGPAQPLAGRPGRRGHPGQDPPGRRRAATTTRTPPAPSAAAPATPSPTSSPASTPRALAALTPRHGGGRRPTYGPEAPARIAAEAARAPTPEADGTATWSLSTLRRTLRAAPDGLPRVSTYTIRRVLHESGASYQRTRTWCPTGKALRRRKAGPAVVTDPDSDAKKS